MKKRYTYTDTHESIEATIDELKAILMKQQNLLHNYEELAVEQADDDAYVARGNGFCDSKYSPEFIDDQIVLIQSKIDQLQKWIDGTEF